MLKRCVELRINYTSVSANFPYKLVIFDHHDIFIIIDPETDITTVEFKKVAKNINFEQTKQKQFLVRNKPWRFVRKHLPGLGVENR